jgi:hypothetical protein
MIPNAGTRVAAAGLVTLGLIALVFFVILTALILSTGLADTFVDILASDEQIKATLGRLAFLLPLALLGKGLIELLKGWHIRTNESPRYSRRLCSLRG